MKKITSIESFCTEIEEKWSKTVFVVRIPIEGVKFRIYSPRTEKFYNREIHEMTDLDSLEKHLKRGLLLWR